MITINVILGSSRSNSLGKHVINYLQAQQEQLASANEINLKLIQLADYQLPFFHEELAPLNNPHRVLPENEQRWLDDMDAADGYVFLTPEYNHAIPAVLKNAIDYLAAEGGRKPAKIMAYSDNERAAQFAAASIVPILQRLGFIVLSQPAMLPCVDLNLTPTGDFLTTAPQQQRYEVTIKRAIKEVSFYSHLFHDHPYVD